MVVAGFEPTWASSRIGTLSYSAKLSSRNRDLGGRVGREEEEGGVKSIPSVAEQHVNVSRGCCYFNDPPSVLKTEA